jgi:pimeloyl-ACP methyl ester carboxylesterase
MTGPTAPHPRRITRPDATLHGEEAGTGPTFLLLHAGGERRQVWTPVTAILTAAGRRCVTYDQRGHGTSEGTAHTLSACAADVAAMLHAEPSPCTVVGASLGGLAAIAALADEPTRAKASALILVDVVPCLDPPRVRSFLSTIPATNPYTTLVEDILTHVIQLEQITAALDVPIHLIRGDTGSSITDEDIAQLLRLAPATTVHTISNAGHLIAREQPAALAHVILDVTTKAA